MNTRVVSIRADCNADVGYGHVMRSLTVARSLGRNGAARARFIMARDSDARPVECFGLEVLRVSGDGVSIDDILAHASPEDGPLLIDSYAVGTKDLERLRRMGFGVAVFDDGRRLQRYPCDVVVDSGPEAPLLPYRGLPETQFCLGSDYFPLRPEFMQRKHPTAVRDTVKTIVVSFGGSDHDDITRRVLDAMVGLDGEFDIVAVLGPAYAGGAEEAAAADGRVFLRRDVADMADVFSGADVAVTGGGSTASELAFLGVPMVLLALSTDQVPVAEALANIGAAVYLGYHDRVTAAAVAQALTALIGDCRQREHMRRAGRALIDGKGAERIADAILAIPRRSDRKMP